MDNSQLIRKENPKLTKHGPIGTKLGTFIIDDNLTTKHMHVALSVYPNFLIESITFGLNWMRENIKDLPDDNKYARLYGKFMNSLDTSNYTDNLNQNIIETAYALSVYLNNMHSQRSHQELLTNSLRDSQNIRDGNQKKHVGPSDLENITEKDVDFSRVILVMITPGKYQLFLKVRHDEHWDILPYDFIIEKIGSVPNLFYGGIKIN